MKTTKLIETLNKLLDKYGDIDVEVTDGMEILKSGEKHYKISDLCGVGVRGIEIDFPQILLCACSQAIKEMK